jgi:anti-sigma B factor antagonist
MDIRLIVQVGQPILAAAAFPGGSCSRSWNRILLMEQIEIRRSLGATGSTTILWLKGPLSLSTLSVLEQNLREIGNVDTVIDVSLVPYVDSAGLGAILSHWAHTQRNGRKFAMTGIRQRINLLLEITKVNTILPAFTTAEEADRAFTNKAATA